MPGKRIPSYRLHKSTGQAVVTLGGRDVYLGKHDTESSREAYERAVIEWQAYGRVGRAPKTAPLSDLPQFGGQLSYAATVAAR